jgi:tetratricopeptide (TPR) repeat protein
MEKAQREGFETADPSKESIESLVLEVVTDRRIEMSTRDPKFGDLAGGADVRPETVIARDEPSFDSDTIIGPINDLGTGKVQRSYAAIDELNGQPIEVYCDERRLDIRSRLVLFGEVIDTVHIAHRYADIHGKLSPESILVTNRGVPKIVGFRTSTLRQIDAAKDEKSADPRTNSLRYASPEQLMGETVTTASDIYALGVILYEILSGRWPYQLKSNNVPEIVEAVYQQVPQKPSTAIFRRPSMQPISRTDLSPSMDAADLSQAQTELDSCGKSPGSCNSASIAAARGLSAGRLKRLLSGDLDAIVLKAIRKEPEERYHSAKHFSDDLRRYVNGLPVQAQCDSWIYRAQKFCRRHSTSVIVGAVFFLALVVGIISAITSAIAVWHERNRTGQSLENAIQVVNDVFRRIAEEAPFDQPPLRPLREPMLQDIKRFYEDLLKRQSDNASLRAELALARVHVAKIATLTGQETEAAAHYQEAVIRWENLLAGQPASQFYRDNLVRTLIGLSAQLIPLKGSQNEAALINHRARKLIEPVINNNSPSAAHLHQLSLILQNSAEIHKLWRESDEVVKDLQQVLEVNVRLAAEYPQSLIHAISLANAHSALGQYYSDRASDSLEAFESYHHAIRIRETIANDHPELIDQSSQLASDLKALSVLQRRLKQPEAAYQSLDRALRISEHISGSFPYVTNYKKTLGASYNMMSELLYQRGEITEALVFASKASILFKSLAANDPENTNYTLGLAQSHNLTGRLLKEDGQFVAAMQSFRRAIDLYESLPQIDARNSFDMACDLALCIPLIGMIEKQPGGSGSPRELNGSDRRYRKIYGDRAIEALRSTASAGFLDTEMLEANPDLNSLHDRADFRVLLQEIEEKRANAGRQNRR